MSLNANINGHQDNPTEPSSKKRKKLKEVLLVDETIHNEKRVDYISWKEFHMGVAMLAKERSKAPKEQVGACIVDSEKKIVGVGYNGMPIGSDDDDMPWGQEDQALFECHAALNAIIFKSNDKLHGCTMYTTKYPCHNCAQLIIQSGIKRVVYLRKFNDPGDDGEDPKNKAARRLFEQTGVAVSEYNRSARDIQIEV